MTLKAKAIRSGFWSALSTGGLVVLQLIQVLILTRYLSKEAFGLFALVAVIVQLVSRFSDMGIGSAIIQRVEPTRDELSSLYWLNVALALGLATLVVILSYPMSVFFADRRLISLFIIA